MKSHLGVLFRALLLFTLLCSPQSLVAAKLYILSAETQTEVAQKLQQTLSISFPQSKVIQSNMNNYATLNAINKALNSDEVISMGFDAIQTSYKRGIHVAIAMDINQSQKAWLQYHFPDKSRNTEFVLNSPMFQCQLALAKKLIMPGKNELVGILMSNRSRYLMEDIQKSAQNLSLNIELFFISAIENPALAMHTVLQRTQMVIFIADDELYDLKNLNAMITEAKVLHKKSIGFTKTQKDIGVDAACTVTEDQIQQNLINALNKLFTHKA